MADRAQHLPSPFPLTSATMLPPPVPPSPQNSSSSSSLGKRKRDDIESVSRRIRQSSTSSNAQTEFSDGAKRALLRIYPSDRCWHCGASPVHICHVVSQKDRDYNSLRSRGLLNLASLNLPENAVVLCPLCHTNFDAMPTPGFIFFPADIEYFINFERRDFERRKELLSINQQRSGRISPTAQEYRDAQLAKQVITEDAIGGQYRRLVVRDYMQEHLFESEHQDHPRTGELHKPTEWHGDPMAALNRTFPTLTTLATSTQIPLPIWLSLLELFQLYNRNDKQLATESINPVISRGAESTASSSSTFVEYPTIELSPTIQPGAVEPASVDDGTPSQQIGHHSHQPVPYAADTVQIDTVVEWLKINASYPLKEVHSVTSVCSQAPTLLNSSTPSKSSHVKSAKLGDRRLIDRGTAGRWRLWKWGPNATTKDVVKFYAGLRNSCKKGELLSGMPPVCSN